MYIHLGNDVMIRADEVIAILEGEPLLKNKKNIQFLRRYEKQGLIVDIGEAFTKSVIITERTVYLSPFSPFTLKRRLETDTPG